MESLLRPQRPGRRPHWKSRDRSSGLTSQKGYGFIKAEQLAPRATSSCTRHGVRQSGFKAAYEARLVVCVSRAGPRGLQARRLISLDNSTAQAVEASSERADRYTAEPHGRPSTQP